MMVAPDESVHQAINDLANHFLKNGESVENTIACIKSSSFSKNSPIPCETEGSLIQSIVNACASNLKRDKRKLQREAVRAISEGKDAKVIPTAESISLEDALERFVFISSGRQIVDLENPTSNPMNVSEFESLFAASKFPYINSKGLPCIKSVVQGWLEHVNRKTACEITYRPNAEIMTRSPTGAVAVNLWRARERGIAPENCMSEVKAFIDHVRWLWGNDAEVFLDWLAHIEQRAGELPHFGWLHIAKSHGMGRNWLASVLSRVWSGNVAPAFDLMGALESGFNGRLSKCHLAIVDEIYEGGTLQWKHDSALRQLVTADQRLINPKYGRQHTEYNVCRWLLFSNHIGALPLSEEDRRFWVVQALESPKSESYYTKLYSFLTDNQFIQSVAMMLATRDISCFNAGQRPPVTEAKKALINMSKSEADFLASQIAENWPVDIIYLSEFVLLLDSSLNGGIFKTKAITHSLDRVNIQRWIKSSGRVRANSGHETVYIIRNHETWQQQDAAIIKKEQGRVSYTAKEGALVGDVDYVSTLKSVINFR